jgi:hypothetical protein
MLFLGFSHSISLLPTSNRSKEIMSTSFALQEFTIPSRREIRSLLGFSDKSAKKSHNFRCYAQKPSILPRSCPTCWDITYGPIVQGRLLTHHSGGRHGDEEGLRWWFLSPAGCREELLDPPDLGTTTTAYSMFHGKVFSPLGFFQRSEYIGGREMSGGGPGAHTTWWHGQGVARATLWCGCLLAPLCISSGLRLRVT